MASDIIKITLDLSVSRVCVNSIFQKTSGIKPSELSNEGDIPTRVVVVSWNIYPGKIGGIEVFNYHFLNWLNTQPDIETCLITSKQMIVFEGTLVKQCKIQMKHFGNIARILYLFRTIISLSDRSNLLFFSYSKSSWKIWFGYYIVASILRIPYFIYIHGGGMYSWKHKFLMRRSFRKAVGIFCVSPLQKKEYENRIGRNIEVLVPVVPYTKYKRDRSILPKSFHISESSFVFLYLGSLRHIKGTDILINAFMKMGRFVLDQDIHLLIVGDGDIEKYLTIASTNVESSNIHFTGRVPNKTVGAYYALSDSFVLPSRIEGMPVALLEAMFNKLPCIIADLQTIPDVFVSGKNCIKFSPEDINELSAQMKFLSTSGELQHIFGNCGYELYKKHWAGDKTFNTLLNAMRACAKK